MSYCLREYTCVMDRCMDGKTRGFVSRKGIVIQGLKGYVSVYFITWVGQVQGSYRYFLTRSCRTQ